MSEQDIEIKPAGESPNAAGVEAFLGGSQQREAFKEGDVKLDIQPELVQELSGEGRRREDLKDPSDTPIDPTFDPISPSVGNTSKWTMVGDQDFEGVEVSDMDKRLYFKAVLNDTAVELTIEIVMGGTKVEVLCRTPGVDEQNLIMQAINELTTENRIKSPAEFYSWFQELSITTQVVRFNEQVIAADIDAILTSEKPVDALIKARHKVFSKMNSARMDALVKAIRIFSYKIKICNDRLLDEDFWNPVGTS
jgi:hypothetical protein